MNNHLFTLSLYIYIYLYIGGALGAIGGVTAVRKLLGNRLCVATSGGAPLSATVGKFIR